MATYLKMAPRLGIAYIPTRELESSRAVEREEEVSRSEESLFKVMLLPLILLISFACTAPKCGKPLRIFNPLNASIQ